MFTGSHVPIYAYPLRFVAMCGIIGFTGQENAVPILIEGLKNLEYRGYDSSGISIFRNDGITTVKAKGRITEIENKINSEFSELSSLCGIGHTRWATHGEPSDVNSHPHPTENLSLVHNGIIENYIEIKERLETMGICFVSQTDTEVAARLIDSKYIQHKNPMQAIHEAIAEIEGSFAFGVIFKDFPGKIFTAKKDSPLLIAIGENGSFIASDIPAVLRHTNKFYRLEDYESAILCGNDITIFDKNGNEIQKTVETVDWSYDTATKSGFPHFMIKEIHDEPDAVIKTVSGRIKDGIPDFGISELSPERIKKCKTIHIVACGTAMHAGLLGKYFIEKYARIPVNVEVASEFRYCNPILDKDDIFIVLSQSGETADTLSALRMAKDQGLYTISVVNVAGSSIARASDSVIYTLAGPEIAVASTKAYTVQTCILYMLAVKLAFEKGTLSSEESTVKTSLLINNVPKTIKETIELSDKIKNECAEIAKHENLFFIGRGIDRYLADEASLKLKEISYIHCEAYAAGELKHGTISLITEGTSVVALITEKDLYSKTLSNIKEVKARGANVTVICSDELEIPAEICDSIIKVPSIGHDLTCLTTMAAFQLLAYHVADKRGCDIDKPRNLAKSVTVE